MNLPSRSSLPACFVATLALLFCSLSHGADVTWTGTSGSWEDGSNWDSGSIPTTDDFAYIASGTVNISEASGTSPNVRGFRQTGGTLNISGGTVEAGQVSQFSDFDGTVTQSGGFASINMVRIGASPDSTGSYTLNNGEFNIARERGNISLNLGGLSSGTGSLTIAGGSFKARESVQLGGDASTGAGTFTVMGSQAGSITIGDNGVDGKWLQFAGSSLVLRFNGNGTTPIYLQDFSGAQGNRAFFANGSVLDVDHLTAGDDFGGTWTVMEVENGSITDQGLQFAPGVDTSVWSFSVDNSGSNGKLIVTAVGDPAEPEGFDLVVGETRQQKMRYGMDFERLWFWNSGFTASQSAQVANWSVVDTRIDYIRVAMNSGFQLEQDSLDFSAYTNKIIPMMTAMQAANPDIKFFASPRPLNEAYPNKKWEGTNVRWQPYPIWVTGAPTPISGNFNFQPDKCVEYIELYLVLMNDFGFKISFLDLSNEWQSNDDGNRLTQADARDVTEGLKASTLLAQAGIEVPKFIAPSSWNYQQGASWINGLSASQRRRDAVDIASGHNTDRTGTAQQFTDAVRNTLGPDTEVWNTEVHGWKSTSNENETTSFYYMLEKIRAGFSGLNGWLAIGQTGQGHAYILNQGGTRRRNVKYFIFRKLSETSNYGHALDMLLEPEQLSHTAALIKGNLMTVWVINQGTSSVPIDVYPLGRTISDSRVKRTRWTDPSDVEGFVTHENLTSNETFWSSIPGESVCCFEILLEPEDEDLSYLTLQAEDENDRNGMTEEQSGDDDGTQNLGNIDNANWARYDNVTLTQDSAMRFRVARPSGRKDGWIEVYLGAPGASSASILDGELVGKVAVPETGGWQAYETIEACLENMPGSYDVILRFSEVGSSDGNALLNLNWFAVESLEAELVLGDFDGDGDVDVDDIDLLSAQMGQPASANPAMDLNGDGNITLADHDQHIQTLVQTDVGTGALIGDLNFDGDVDVSQFDTTTFTNVGDASILLSNLGLVGGASYADGDLNGDGDVDISEFDVSTFSNVGDASRLLSNLGQSQGPASSTSSAAAR